jgi:hypothetical protein
MSRIVTSGTSWKRKIGYDAQSTLAIFEPSNCTASWSARLVAWITFPSI